MPRTTSPQRGEAVPHELMALAERLARLSPCHRDPEKFHIDRSELVHELKELARRA